MTSPFQKMPPARIRFESADHSVDAIVPAALVCFPDPEDAGQIRVFSQSENPAQMLSLVVTMLRWAILTDMMGAAMKELASAPIDGKILPQPRRDNIPPDDIPQHLRKPRPGSG